MCALGALKCGRALCLFNRLLKHLDRYAQTKVITEIRKNDHGERIKVERTVKVRTC
jgi:hypothetical protein